MMGCRPEMLVTSAINSSMYNGRIASLAHYFTLCLPEPDLVVCLQMCLIKPVIRSSIHVVSTLSIP